MLCRSCSNTTCRSLSTERDRIEIECPKCNGEGCEECSGGMFAIDGCPNNYCSPVVRSLTLFDLFEKGLPPVAGGVMDQANSFIEAAQFFESEERRVKNERISRDPY
jgi:hypothetical protein